MADGSLTPCNAACGSGITQNFIHRIEIGNYIKEIIRGKLKKGIFENRAPGFDFGNITAVDMSFCTSPKFYPNRTPSAEKNDVMSIFKMADLSHLGFKGTNNGFFEKPMYDFL